MGNPEEKSDTPTPPDETPSTSDKSLVGKIVGGKYRILEQIGQGGMGVVFKAQHILVDRIVALKVLHSHLTSNENFLRRFHHEAKIGSQVNHPNAVTLWDYGIEDNLPYLVLEYVEGITLEDLLVKEGPLSLERIAGILEQVTAALTAAHNLGIVHRDLKPDNIMLTGTEPGSERVRVLDFGIAKAINGLPSGPESVAMTQAGMLMGTPQYISPEQALEKDLDPRSDMYSLGVIMYEMLSGAVPFKSNSPLETYIQHINTNPRPIREIVPHLNLPRGVCDVVMKTLEKEPSSRFKDVQEMFKEFQRAVLSQEVAPSIPTVTPKGFPFIPVAGAVGAIAVLSFAAWMLLNTEKDLGTVDGVQVAAVETAPVEEPTNETASSETLATEKTAAETTGSETAETATPPEVAAENTVTANLFEPSKTTPEIVEQAEARALAPTEVLEPQVVVEEPKKVEAPVVETIAEPAVQAAVETKPEVAIDTKDEEKPAGAEHIVTEEPTVAVAITPPNDEKTEAPPVEAKTETAALETPPTDPATTIATTIAPQEAPSGELEALLADLPPPAKANAASAKANREAVNLFKSGEKAMKAKEYLKAAGLFKTSLKTDAGSLEARLNFASCLLRLNQYSAAQGQFQEALKLDGEYAPSHYSLAAAFALGGDTDNAIKSLETAISLFPGATKWLQTDKDFDSLRADDRFRALLKK